MSNPPLPGAAGELKANADDPVIGTDTPLVEPTDVSTSGKSESSSEDREDTAQDPVHVSWSTRINPLKWNPPPVPDAREPSREPTAGWVSKLTFEWATPIMTTGYKRTLQMNDIWAVNPKRSSRTVSGKLEKSFKERVGRNAKRPLLGALYETVRYEFLLGGFCQLLATIFQTVSPYLLKYLIAFADQAYTARRTNTKGPPIGRGLGWVFGILAFQICTSLANNQFLYRGESCGGETRAALMTVIFDKAMRISGHARAGGAALKAAQAALQTEAGSSNDQTAQKDTKKGKQKKKRGTPPPPEAHPGWSNGRIINLMSVDAYRIDMASAFFHMLWTAPIQIIITLILLIINLTYSALAGFFFLVLTTPLIAQAIRGLLRRRIVINKITDQRISVTQETLSSIRFVKFLGWEPAFLDRVFNLRKQEILAIQKLLATRNAINAVSMALPIFASMIAFVVYSVTNHSLEPASVFSSLALFNNLRAPLNFLPMVLGQVIDAISSVRRIQEFLLSDDAEEDFDRVDNDKNAVEAEQASFTWERIPVDEFKPGGSGMPGGRGPPFVGPPPEAKKKKRQSKSKKGPGLPEKPTIEEAPYSIQDINLAIGRDELVAIIGSVGSGKTSLLAALAGDMRKTGGKVSLGDGMTRAFCPQSAWIQNATLRSNIIFGREFDQSWYDSILNAAALRPDLEQLPAGDMTEIGERGITISGGQKQRINIARAMYSDADIVLLDDPLSAVDPHVGRHIMEHAICGVLKGKCRILATHQLHVLHRCDRIIWMEGGRIKSFDTFKNLMDNNDDFQLMMSDMSADKDEEKESTDDKEESGGDKDKNAPKASAKATELMTTEERGVKSIPFAVYMAYLRGAGGYWVLPLVLILLAATQCSNIATSLWLSWWTANSFHFSKGKYIGIYTALGASQAIVMFLFSVSLSIFGTRASKYLLRDSMARVFRAPMSFFDTTPLGRITNRFSRDVDTLDNNLTDSIRMYFMTLASIIGTFVLIIFYFHLFAAVLGPLAVLFLFAASFYRASAREVKRLEAVARSDVFSRFSEAITGVSTIRAYGLQHQFQEKVRDAIDSTNGVYFLTMVNQRWLSFRLDMIGAALVFTLGILVVTSRFSVNPSISGLVLSYILAIVQMLTFTIRQLAEVENNMNSAERLHYYATKIDEEAPLKLMPVSESWPERGEIVFQDVQMRYREGLPLVLNGLSLHVAAGERIGIIGRTGAGKSSIMTTLFRMAEVSGGSITIDGVDISKVGLQDLRSRLSIIPQDPTLLRGTIRRNLDPFDEHSDLDLWRALQQAYLVGTEVELPTSKPAALPLDEKADTSVPVKTKINLETPVEEEGANFSLGQRQLLALARALVRNSRIVVCDEATSSVDYDTDQKIQDTMMRAFKDRTMLVIAHRLRTILSYDRIVVMDQGRIAELDNPLALYDAGGIFRSMCARSGISRSEVAKYHGGSADKVETG